MSSSIPIKFSRPALVTVQELASVLFLQNETEQIINRDLPDQGIKIFDASAGGFKAHDSFLEKSIPTSRFFNGLQDLVEPEGKYPYEFPSEGHVIDVLQSTGVESSDNLILYAQPGRLVGAARTFTVLNAYGLNVRILNGGLLKYIQEGYPTEPGVEAPATMSSISSLQDPQSSLSHLETLRKFGEAEGEQDLQVVDLRPGYAFNGNDPTYGHSLKQGNVKGAVNISGEEFLNEDETFKSEQDIQDLFEKHNLDPTKDTIFMCRAGVAATIGYAALNTATPGKFGKTLLYDRGWNEFGDNHWKNKS